MVRGSSLTFAHRFMPCGGKLYGSACSYMNAVAEEGRSTSVVDVHVGCCSPNEGDRLQGFVVEVCEREGLCARSLSSRLQGRPHRRRQTRRSFMGGRRNKEKEIIIKEKIRVLIK